MDGNKGFQYEGDWKDNCMHGMGVMKAQNGEVYSGGFEKNNK